MKHRDDVNVPVSDYEVYELMRRTSYLRVLLALFITPLRGILVACGKDAWFRGLALLLSIGMLGAGARVLRDLPDWALECRNVAEFVGANLGEISFADGRLRHGRTLSRPVRGRFGFGRIDLLAQGQKITDSLLGTMGNDGQGVIVSDERIVFWKDVGQVMPYTSSERISMLIGQIGQQQRAGKLPEKFSPGYLAEMAPRFCYMAAPLLIVWKGAGRTALMVFYALLLCMMVGSVRRVVPFFQGSSFVFALHAVVVPFVVALVYSICFPEYLSFEPVFWLASVGYLGYGIWEVKDSMRSSSGNYPMGKGA